MESFLKIKDLK